MPPASEMPPDGPMAFVFCYQDNTLTRRDSTRSEACHTHIPDTLARVPWGALQCGGRHRDCHQTAQIQRWGRWTTINKPYVEMGHCSYGSGPQRRARSRGSVPVRKVWEGFLEEAGWAQKEKQALSRQAGGGTALHVLWPRGKSSSRSAMWYGRGDWDSGDDSCL